MKDLNKQIDKLQKELDELKKIAGKPKSIELSEPATDINGKELKLSHKDATEYARLIGSRLPTIEELRNLLQEQKDKIGDRWCWSGSPLSLGDSFVFNGFSASVIVFRHSYEGSVLCVLNEEREKII